VLWLVARSSTYALTDRRLLMAIGVAFPSVFNVPLHLVEQVAARNFRNGAGDVALELRDGNRIGYLFLWPHARPWQLSRPQPMLRGLPEVGPVAEQLRDAVLKAMEDSDGRVDSHEGVRYSLQDDDGVEILSNRRPTRETQQA